MVTQLLTQHWGYDKYIRWLQGLQKQYTDRRNLLLDHLLATFDISEEHDDSFLGGNKVYVARDKRPSWTLEPKLEEKKGKDTWFTFIPPTSGMFIWVRVHLVNHPAYGKSLDDPTSLEAQLFDKLARSGLLVGPGWIFSTRVDENIPIPPPELSGRPITVPRLSGRKHGDPSGDPEDHDDNKYAHFRLAFASASDDEMTRAMVIFSTVLRQFFKDGHL
ncbi:hypothetical protein FRB99_004359 [Tulasnella sp. 403]|nr:hypothetical protein FRB99_004359 [Tulasnella sp. 403]